MDSTSESHFHKNASKETLTMKCVISVPLAAEFESVWAIWIRKCVIPEGSFSIPVHLNSSETMLFWTSLTFIVWTRAVETELYLKKDAFRLLTSHTLMPQAQLTILNQCVSLRRDYLFEQWRMLQVAQNWLHIQCKAAEQSWQNHCTAHHGTFVVLKRS